MLHRTYLRCFTNTFQNENQFCAFQILGELRSVLNVASVNEARMDDIRRRVALFAAKPSMMRRAEKVALDDQVRGEGHRLTTVSKMVVCYIVVIYVVLRIYLKMRVNFVPFRSSVSSDPS